MTDHPSKSDVSRLLVASEFAPNSPGGGPAVIRQMLREWPADRLAWWSCLPDRHGRSEIPVTSHFTAPLPAKLIPHARFTRLKAWMLERFWVRRAASHLRETIATWRPDVVWSIPHQWATLPMAAVLPVEAVGLHVTVQDYMDARSHGSRLGGRRASRFARAAEQLYRTAHTRDATSHPMIEDLERQTGRAAGQMLHAGLEQEDFDFLSARPPLRTEPIRIAHAGTIIVEEAFVTAVRALHEARTTRGLPVELHFYGAHQYAGRPWFDRAWMFEHGNMPERELLTELRTCTWGFSPMDLTDDDPRYNRFSFPTKFITYLAAGLPVITIGHAESSVMKMARNYGVGFCSDTTDVQTLAAQLREALSVSDPWLKYGGEILRCAKAEFDARRMRATLTRCLHTGANP